MRDSKKENLVCGELDEFINPMSALRQAFYMNRLYLASHCNILLPAVHKVQVQVDTTHSTQHTLQHFIACCT
jgi:hypothetical protein